MKGIVSYISARQGDLMGLLQVLNLQTLKNCKLSYQFLYVLSRKEIYLKIYLKSLNLRTSFLPYKISRIHKPPWGPTSALPLNHMH